MRLIDELNELYAHYLREINSAVARDDLAAAELLAQAYEDDAVQLMAEREGRTAMLPLHPPWRPRPRDLVGHQDADHRAQFLDRSNQRGHTGGQDPSEEMPCA